MCNSKPVRSPRILLLTVAMFAGLSWAVASQVQDATAVKSDRELTFTADLGTTARVNRLIDEMMQPELLDRSPLGGLSSNPYDFTHNNPKYEELVAIGIEALPALETELANSSADGLREYMLGIAIEEISGCDLKQFPDSHWDRASQFSEKWSTYLSTMPERTKSILNGRMSSADKAQAIMRLGRPAVPFVIDGAEDLNQADEAALAEALVSLTPGTRREDTISEYAANNGQQVAALRRYVHGK